MTGEIADNTATDQEQRIAALDGCAALIEGHEPSIVLDVEVVQAVHEFKAAAISVGADIRHAQHVIQAQRQNMSKMRYRDWNELLAYSRYAAAPFGRFVLDMSGKDRAPLPAAEALCCALHILTLLRDCGSHYRAQSRVYVPER